MLVVVSTEDGNISPHFGRCQQYTLYEVADGVIKSKRLIDNPGHEPGLLPKLLSNLGVRCVIAGGMGPRAQQMFDSESIDVITGVSGSVDDAINDFVRGKLPSSGNRCDHGHPDGCDHR